jgi:4'-phosphopantetheinyl transferase
VERLPEAASHLSARPGVQAQPSAGARVEVGECRLDDDRDICLSEAGGLLDAGERERAGAFLFARDRERFVRAHGYLRRMLGAFLRLPPAEVPIVAPKDEKPFVDGRRVDFSLSHSGGLAVLAVTEAGDVGLDVELLDWSQRFADDLEGLARSCMAVREQAALAAVDGAERVRRFMAYWTAKEARMKLTGEGLALEPQEIELQLRKGEPVGYRRPHPPQADLHFLRLRHPDAVCCLALRRQRGIFTRPGRAELIN